MSKINVSTITNRTGTSGPVLSGVTTATNGFNVTGGNVGIGTDNPSTSLTVGDVTSPGTIRGAVAIKSQATGISLPYANIYLEEPDIGDVTGEGYYLSVNSAGDLDFVNSGSVTVLTMSDNNNIGIGVTIPSDKLSVYNNNIGNPTGITIRNTEASSTYSHARLRLESQNGAAYGEIWADVANAGLRLGYNSSSTVKIDSTGNLHFGAGKGINFSANSDTGRTVSSNVFDDYEEGTFVPGVSFGGAVVGITYGEAVGTYTKVGRFVFCTIVMSLTNKGSSTGNALLTGLPFATQNDGNARGGGGLTYMDAFTSLNQIPAIYSVSNSTVIYLYQMNSSAGAGTRTIDLTSTNFTNTSTLRTYFSYYTDT